MIWKPHNRTADGCSLSWSSRLIRRCVVCRYHSYCALFFIWMRGLSVASNEDLATKNVDIYDSMVL